MSEVSEASHRWPRVALSALAAVAPFNVKLTAETWTQLELRLLVIVALVLVVALTVRGLVMKPRPDRVDSIAFALLAMIWLSALVSDNVVFGSGGAIRLSVAVLLIPATRSVVRTSGDARQVLQALGLGTAVGAVIGLGVWAIGGEANVMRVFAGEVTKLGSFDRLTRPWSHANVAAMAMGATVASAATIRSRQVKFAALAVITVALVLTISRGGLLAAAGAALTWVVLRRDRIETAVIASLLVLGALVFATSSAWTTRVDQLGDQAFYGSTLDVPATFIVDPAVDDLVPVTITNESVTAWPQTGDDRVLISARWIGSDGLIWTEDWWELPRDLVPGESVSTGLTVDARLPAGTYQVRWDLIIPRTAYFGQFLGDAPIVSQGIVASSTVDVDDLVRYELVERSVGIGRVEGWKLAWNDFTSSPLLGVGPNQFADQARQVDGQSRWVGAHAHHLVLEPLATWGLLGTIPFLVLGAGAVLRTLRRAWRTRDLAATVVATSLIAVLIHGNVDWPLVTITNAIPVGLLIGLAWSDVCGVNR